MSRTAQEAQAGADAAHAGLQDEAADSWLGPRVAVPSAVVWQSAQVCPWRQVPHEVT